MNTTLSILKKSALALSTILLISINSYGQEPVIPRPSSTQTVIQQLGTSQLTVRYARPAVKGRKIFGTLVPYDEIWRTGADKLTDITVEKEITIAGQKLAPGRYSIMTIPNKKEWSIIINQEPDLWGTAAHKPEKDVFRFTVTPSKLKERKETFEIGFENVTAFTADLEIRWDKTKISIPININQDKEIEQAIEKAIADGKKPYVEATIFYLNNNKVLTKPLEWMKLAEQDTNDQPYIYYWKAMVENVLGMKNESLESAIKSLNLAQQVDNKDYIRMSKALIKKLK